MSRRFHRQSQVSCSRIWADIRCRLRCKQSPEAWNIHLYGHLEKFGFKKFISGTCVFIKTYEPNLICIIAIYFDDLLITGSNNEVKSLLSLGRRIVQWSVRCHSTNNNDGSDQQSKSNRSFYVKELMTVKCITTVVLNFLKFAISSAVHSAFPHEK